MGATTPADVTTISLRPPVAERLKQSTRVHGRPDRAWDATRTPNPVTLLDLARGGVCHASCVAARAVGSYPTFSPLPRASRPAAVCFLWHCPSSLTLPRFRTESKRRVGVTHHRVLSCSDFPQREASLPPRPPCRVFRESYDAPAPRVRDSRTLTHLAALCDSPSSRGSTHPIQGACCGFPSAKLSRG